MNRVIAFHTLDKDWVKVQLVPCKENNSSSLAFRSFDPDQSEATEISRGLSSVRSFLGLSLWRSQREPGTCWARGEALPFQVCRGPAAPGLTGWTEGASTFSSLRSYLYPLKPNTACSAL